MKNIISFTGHRPNKLGGYDFNTKHNILIRQYFGRLLLQTIIKSDDNFHFITGGAIGFDQMMFHVCYLLRDKYFTNKDKITVELAIPFKKQYIMWRDIDKQRHFEHLKLADICTEVDTIEKYKCDKVHIELYHKDKMQLRNMYMVDNANTIYALWNGTSGGTNNCVKYAKSLKKNVIITHPDLFNTILEKEFKDEIV